MGRPGHTTRLSQNRNHEIPKDTRSESRIQSGVNRRHKISNAHVALPIKVRTLRSLTARPLRWGALLLVALFFLAGTVQGASEGGAVVAQRPNVTGQSPPEGIPTAKGASSGGAGPTVQAAFELADIPACLDDGGFEKLMAGEYNIAFPKSINPDETVAVLWGAIWHCVKAYHATLSFVVPDNSGKYGEAVNSSDALRFMIPLEKAIEQLEKLDGKGDTMLNLLKTLNCSHVICLREFIDTKPTWSEGFHEKSPNAYVYDIGSGQAQGFNYDTETNKSILDKDSKFSYYEATKRYQDIKRMGNATHGIMKNRLDTAKDACKDCTKGVFRQTETMNAVAERIAQTLARIHNAEPNRPLIVRGTGKHRQGDGPDVFADLVKMIKTRAFRYISTNKVARSTTSRSHTKFGGSKATRMKRFNAVFSGKLLTGAQEAKFGSTSVCHILGPYISGLLLPSWKEATSEDGRTFYYLTAEKPEDPSSKPTPPGSEQWPKSATWTRPTESPTSILSVESGKGSTQYGFWINGTWTEVTTPEEGTVYRHVDTNGKIINEQKERPTTLPVKRRRMAQREFSSRRDSPVMVRLLQQIIDAQDD